jgi:hypothetical protein
MIVAFCFIPSLLNALHPLAVCTLISWSTILIPHMLPLVANAHMLFTNTSMNKVYIYTSSIGIYFVSRISCRDTASACSPSHHGPFILGPIFSQSTKRPRLRLLPWCAIPLFSGRLAFVLRSVVSKLVFFSGQWSSIIHRYVCISAMYVRSRLRCIGRRHSWFRGEFLLLRC